jgi:predicted ATP-grasp superfamily ATP-dependent carboligase
VRNGQPGALLLGSDFKALGVARSLGRHGVPIAVVDTLPRSAWFSRYVDRRFKWTDAMRSGAFVHFLLDLAQRASLKGWVLWPAQDDALELVARNATLLSASYRLITQPWEVLRMAHDKRCLHQAADEAGVAHPRTWHPADERALEEMPLQFPVILKPRVSVDLQNTFGRKAIPAANLAELDERYWLATRVVPADDLMVQEIVPSEAQYSVGAFAENGRVLMAMTARRTRQFPIDYGLSSSFVEAVDMPELIEPARRVLERLGTTGMVEVEFIVDRRDGQPKLLDVNPRPWGWHSLCAACGLDFPLIQYDHTLGRPVPHLMPRYGPRWIRLLTDVPAGLQGIRAGVLTPGAYLRSVAAGQTVESVFEWRDPLPAVGDLAVAAVRVMKAIVKHERPQGFGATLESTRLAKLAAARRDARSELRGASDPRDARVNKDETPIAGSIIGPGQSGRVQ